MPQTQRTHGTLRTSETPQHPRERYQAARKQLEQQVRERQEELARKEYQLLQAAAEREIQLSEDYARELAEWKAQQKGGFF